MKTKQTKQQRANREVVVVGDFLICTREALRRLGCGKTKLFRELADPKSDFPKPVKTSPNHGGHLRFSNAEISAWLESRLAMRAVTADEGGR